MFRPGDRVRPKNPKDPLWTAERIVVLKYRPPRSKYYSHGWVLELEVYSSSPQKKNPECFSWKTVQPASEFQKIDWPTILNVSPTASNKQVHKAYDKKINTLINKKLPPFDRQLQLVQEAYQVFLENNQLFK